MIQADSWPWRIIGALARRPHGEPMPQRFEELAGYNSRKSQGIQHDPEYVARMAVLQADFDRWTEPTRGPGTDFQNFERSGPGY